MKSLLAFFLLCFTAALHATAPPTAETPTTEPAPIPFSEIGAKATADYEGDAIGITATPGGALLRTGFQKLAGTVTQQGLSLESTDAKGGRLKLAAAAVGRGAALRQSLPATGTVSVTDKLVTFARPGLLEEYSVSVDGVRQDFIVAERPAGEGKLSVELALSGATAAAAADGARLTLDGSGRVLAYSRLRVTDATGRELAAALEVLSPARLAVRVEDAGAVYPVRIDPTFSDADWVSLNPGIPGANNTVNAAVVDGSGNLYIGGNFTFVGTVAASRIAKWNGSAWSALGTGTSNNVHALAVIGTDLYAGGLFSTAGGVTVSGIAKWNGSAWSALGTGLDGTVNALAVSGTDLYVGGLFTMAGGAGANYVAKWNGSAWSALGAGTNNAVRALAVSGTDLYAAGSFTTADGGTVNRVAKWNGSAWSALGTGMETHVRALAVIGTDLYAGGDFATAGGVSAIRIAKWNGSVWSALGTGINNQVNALAVSGTDLYAGGLFTTAGGVTVNRIAKWDGSAWSALGTGMNNGVNALAVGGTDLYAGGNFTTAGGGTATYVAKWNGSAWSALGTGMDNTVNALAVIGTDLYAGGDFTSAGGITVNRIAKWNGSAWSALGTGMSGGVGALAVIGTDLYAGGFFTTADGVTVNRIAKWNGSTWSALGAGMNGGVYALTVSGTDLYAGGDFTTADGVTVNRTAKWNGSTWSALGTGADALVFALKASGTDLYAGGQFTTAGGVTVNRIAKWNGSTWSALGTGMTASVRALAVIGTDLYAGGDFFDAGGVSVSRLAKWNGSAWADVGTGLDNSVNALTVSGTDLYVGGNFLYAGAVAANRIAKWDGSAWSALGTGTDGIVRALALNSSNQLILGGSFTFVGTTTVSPFIAQADIAAPAPTPPTVTAISPASGSTTGGTSVTITGTGFTGATGVTIGGVAATSVVVVNDTTITALTPAGTAGSASVVVTTPGGTNAANTLFTYVAPPTITAILPPNGSTAGGSSVTIIGTGFTGATGVTLGGVAATGVTVINDTMITATTGAHAAGAADVAVTTAGGTGTGTGMYTYGTAPVAAGASWTERTGAGTRSWQFIASSADGTKLAAAANGAEIYTSADAGATWTARDSIRGWFGIASSADGSKLVAVVANGFIYTSTNSGVTWTERESSRSWRAVTSSADGTRLAAVVDNGQIYTSADSGATWTPRESARFWRAITSSADGSKLAAVVASGQIHTSTDYGVTWTARETNRSWLGITSSADGTKLLACANSAPLYVSTDSGVTWSATTSSSIAWKSCASSADGTRLAACAYGDQIYTSTDSGGTWTAVASTQNWRAIASSADGGRLAAGADPASIWTSQGAVPPTVTSLDITSGSTAGGTSVTITGTGFTGATAVTFGGTNAASFNVDSATQITATTSAHAAGVVSVEVTTPGGTSAANTLFSYNSPITDITLTPASIAENNAVNATVGTLAAVDADAGQTHTFTLVIGTGDMDNSSFTIDGTALKLAPSANFENKSSYSLRVQADDGIGGTFAKSLTVTVIDLNETFVAIGPGANLADVNQVDGGGGRTNIEEGYVNVAAGTHTVSSFTFNSNSTTGTLTPFLAVLVGTDNYQPVWVGPALTPAGTGVQTVSYTAGSQLFSLASAADLYVGFTQTDAIIRLADPGGGTNTDHFNFAVTPVVGTPMGTASHPDLPRNYAFAINFVVVTNRLPTDISLAPASIMENNAANATVGTLAAVDADVGQTHTFTLVAGTGDTDNGDFNISGSDLRLTTSADFETQSSYSIRVQADDGNGGTFARAFTVTITDNVNEFTPAIASVAAKYLVVGGGLSNTNAVRLMRLNPAGTAVVSSAALPSNASGSHTYMAAYNPASGQMILGNSYFHLPTYLSSGTFTLNLNAGIANNSPWQEHLPSGRFVTVRRVGGSSGAIQTFNPVANTITDGGTGIGGIPEASWIYGGALYNADEGLGVRSIAVAADGSTTGSMISLSPNPILDRSIPQGDGGYTETSRAAVDPADGTTLLLTGHQNIYLFDLDVAPASGDYITRNLHSSLTTSGGGFTADLTKTDVRGVVFDPVTGVFYVQGGLVNASYQSGGDFIVRVTKAGDVTVVAQELAGDLIYSDNTNNGLSLALATVTPNVFTLAENSANGTTVGTAVGTDGDAGAVFSGWAITSGNTGGAFAINASTGAITVAASSALNFETTPVFTLGVTVSDGTNTSAEGFVTINLSNVNEAPTDITLSSASIAENNAPNATVGTLTATDADAGATHTFVKVTGAGDTDNGNFTISGNALRLTPSADFETKSSYSVRVQADDGLGGTFAKALVITITDVEDTNANLSSLALSVGTLAPAFSASTTAYTATVSSATSSITVTPTQEAAIATIHVRLNGGTYVAVASGSPSGAQVLSYDANTIDIRVTALDGTTTKTYTVTVTREGIVPVFIGTSGGTGTGTGSGVIEAPDSTGTTSVGSWESIRGGAVHAANGVMAFRGHLEIGSGTTPVSVGDFQGIWKYDGVSTRLLARSGNVAPEADGALFDMLPQNPSVSPNGLITFFGTLRMGTGTPAVTSANNMGLWSELGGGAVRLLARKGDVIPGTAGDQTLRTWSSVASSSVSTLALNAKLSTGSALIHLDVSGPDTLVTVMAEEGKLAPGGGVWNGLQYNSSDPRMSAAGDVVFIGWELDNGAWIAGIYSRPGSTVAGVSGVGLEARVGGTAPGTSGATFNGFERPTAYTGGLAFRGFLSQSGDNAAGTRGQGIWSGPFGALVPVVRTGDTNAQIPTIPAGSSVMSIWSPFGSATGALAFRVSLVTGGSERRAIMGSTGGTMRLIANFGDVPPGMPGEIFANFDHPVIGDGDQVAFTASTNMGSYGIWKEAAGGGALSLILKVGDQVNTSEGMKTVSALSLPGMTTDDRKDESECLDAAGRLLIHVTFDDGTTSLLQGE